MKGKFFGIAVNVSERLSRLELYDREITESGVTDEGYPDKQVSVSDIKDTVLRGKANINCYPGNPANACFQTAIFISLQGKYAKKGNYNFGTILEKFVNHMNGKCKGITREAAIITNSWWPQDYDYYFHRIQNIKKDGLYLESYFIGPAGRNHRPDERILRLDI